MHSRRYFGLGLVAVTAMGLHSARAQGYPPPRYSDEEEEDHRRYEERRREAEERRREYYGRPGRPNSVIGLEEERNRRVLGLQLQLQHGEIGRRQFDERVEEIDRELHGRLGQ